MILDMKNEPISMKEEPRLSCIGCTRNSNNLEMRAPDMPVLSLPMRPDLCGGKVFKLNLMKQLINVVECGDEARKWVSDYLGRSAYMVFSCPDLGTRDAYLRQRKWDNEAKSGDVSIFAYLTSYLVTSTASLKHINSQLDTPVSMVNFRPNLVIDNTEPFDEDNWREILIGDQILFHTVEPCRRCVITTIEPETAKKRADVQPLKLLRSFRCRAPYGASPLFGVYFSNDFPGYVKVGDPVYVLKA
ncbi:mitochondrial amidoxime-reducing component 1 [Elysia marginata]|uniref:Mitochondrial amidoxime-reducing component 1 n=1 Tax=Elysia marginata TaxID=1093978 RepID=A0AAV4IT01_9GAST|nr:mitochondrial amidoxime-reducing component 1 [Elysia marginata]